jgi:hypothetical protein
MSEQELFEQKLISARMDAAAAFIMRLPPAPINVANLQMNFTYDDQRTLVVILDNENLEKQRDMHKPAAQAPSESAPRKWYERPVPPMAYIVTAAAMIFGDALLANDPSPLLRWARTAAVLHAAYTGFIVRPLLLKALGKKSCG